MKIVELGLIIDYMTLGFVKSSLGSP